MNRMGWTWQGMSIHKIQNALLWNSCNGNQSLDWRIWWVISSARNYRFSSPWKELTLAHYRPQTKFAKVMFLHLSVSHSVHRGEYLGRYPPQAGTPTGQVHPLGRYTPCAGTPPFAGTPPWVGTPPLGRYTCHAGIWSTSGRYASYWNAFLLLHSLRSTLNFFMTIMNGQSICLSRGFVLSTKSERIQWLIQNFRGRVPTYCLSKCRRKLHENEDI